MNRELEEKGFEIVPGVLSPSEIETFERALAPLLEAVPSAGVRGLAEKVPSVRELAHSVAVRALVEPVLGAQARLVRSILFNKSQETNWQVAWHQDLAIAVQGEAEVDGFGSWSNKDGVPHVQPPVAVLERMLTVRLHLGLLKTQGDSNADTWLQAPFF